MSQDERMILLRVRLKAEALKNSVAEFRACLPEGEDGEPIESGLAEYFEEIEYILYDIYKKLDMLPLHEDLAMNIISWVSAISSDAIELARDAREIADPGQSSRNTEIIISKLKGFRKNLMAILDVVDRGKDR
nr:MAG TPA: hypothetical protein [Caudoviricetes sp.]